MFICLSLRDFSCLLGLVGDIFKVGKSKTNSSCVVCSAWKDFPLSEIVLGVLISYIPSFSGRLDTCNGGRND